MAEKTKKDEQDEKKSDKSESDNIIEKAKKKADAEKKKRIATAADAELSEEQLRSISLEKRVRKYIKPDGLFRKDLSSEDLDIAQKVLEKAGRKIKFDKDRGRPMAVPGWDESIDTRRPLINE